LKFSPLEFNLTQIFSIQFDPQQLRIYFESLLLIYSSEKIFLHFSSVSHVLLLCFLLPRREFLWGKIDMKIFVLMHTRFARSFSYEEFFFFSLHFTPIQILQMRFRGSLNLGACKFSSFHNAVSSINFPFYFAVHES
jgi:hypothetical protein